MTSTPGSDAERGREAEERHEQARQRGAEEEYDAVHGTDRGVHAPLDAVGRDRLPVGDVIRVFDAHREAVDELRDRDDDQHDGDAGVGGERREREHEPRDHDQDSAEKDRLAGAEPHADTGRDHRTDEAADAPAVRATPNAHEGRAGSRNRAYSAPSWRHRRNTWSDGATPTTSMARATESMSSDSRCSMTRSLASTRASACRNSAVPRSATGTRYARQLVSSRRAVCAARTQPNGRPAGWKHAYVGSDDGWGCRASKRSHRAGSIFEGRPTGWR